MPTLAEFFLGCVYVIFGGISLAIAIALTITIAGTALIEVRKRWPGK